MQELTLQLLWFLPWCWCINISLNILGYVKSRFSFIDTSDSALDGSMRFFDGRPLFGPSTTWGGFLLVLLLGSVGEYVFPGHFFLAFALSVFFGDTLGSFFKRRLSMENGAFLFGIDHVDYVLVGGILALSLERFSYEAFIASYLLTLILTPLITFLAYQLHLRREKL